MKILHLFSDWKWTGSAEPALEMVKGLRDEGVDVQFATSTPPSEDKGHLRKRVLAAGFSPIEDFALCKHFHPIQNLKDSWRLTRFIKEQGYDLVHTHRHQDHLIGGIAARRAGVPVVRSSHEGRGLKNDWRNRYIMKKLTSLYLPVSRVAAETDRVTFSLPDEKIQILPPAIDTDNFDPKKNYKNMQAEYGIPQGKIIIGIVARMQPHRYFEDLLDSWVKVNEQRDDVHFVIMGRGSKMDEVAVQPSREKGLSDVLTFAGYHGETYKDMLNTFDIKMFLVAGSDGSCRALRQALSLGIPAITSDRGMLAEIVHDGLTGLVTDGSAENLASAQLKLLENFEVRRQMSRNARQFSVEKYSLKSQSERLITLYDDLIA